VNRQNEIAILYSGGTDSTCAASIMAEEFKIIHLLTFKRFGLFSIENSCRNVDILKEKFPSTIFIHKIIDIDRLAKYISYSHFIQDLFKYGFFILSNCIFCGLIHHFGALIYCLDNKITNVADGSTREWPFFPTHMEKVISEFREMYTRFNIKYYTPVYNFELPSPFRFIDKIYTLRESDREINNDNPCKKTTGRYLFKLGILPSSDVKGTNLDHKMQPRCLQFILHHLYLYWYFMPLHDYSKFELITLKFLREKINYLVTLIERNPKKVKKLSIISSDRREFLFL